jgi:hypothetical protein
VHLRRALLLFAIVFKLLPDVNIRWSDVWVGAAITAVLFMVGRELIGLYLGRTGIATTYGQAGSLAALLVWIYYSSVIFFFGAEFTQVYARMMGRRIEPAQGAVRITDVLHEREAGLRRKLHRQEEASDPHEPPDGDGPRGSRRRGDSRQDDRTEPVPRRESQRQRRGAASSAKRVALAVVAVLIGWMSRSRPG